MIDNVEILGTLYRNEKGEIMLLNDWGLHTVLLEPGIDAGLPQHVSSFTYAVSHEVNWGKEDLEIWVTDLWDDLIEDTRDEQGEEGVKKMASQIVATFPSVILTT
mgnify:CR=1 FL=1